MLGCGTQCKRCGRDGNCSLCEENAKLKDGKCHGECLIILSFYMIEELEGSSVEQDSLDTLAPLVISIKSVPKRNE